MPIPYASITQFLQSVDARVLAELSADSPESVGVGSSNTLVASALNRASYEVESFALRGNIYTQIDLDDLQTAEDWMLAGLVCDLALGILVGRRVGSYSDAVKERLGRASATLADLRDGKRVFRLAKAASAGIPSLEAPSVIALAVTGLFYNSAFFPRSKP